jgi:CheY-like chemotaxis protein
MLKGRCGRLAEAPQGLCLTLAREYAMTTVLVVDDSMVDRRLVGGLLERDSGWAVKYAENGRDALAKLSNGGADVVITDMQMPEMDGLDLVKSIRVQYADLPVVLMTAHGSEALAVEALERGAASYVPKSQISERLIDTVEHVLALLRADRSYERLIECMMRNEFTFLLENDTALIDPLVDLMQQMVVGLRLCDAIGRVRVGMALEQALLNALYRGNLEITPEQMQQSREQLLQGGPDLVEQRRSQSPYRERRIFVDVQVTREEARFVVRDEGPGFDTATVPAAHDPRILEQEGGRGLVLMRSFMDDVTFSAAGNEVTMIKRRQEAVANETAADTTSGST